MTPDDVINDIIIATDQVIDTFRKKACVSDSGKMSVFG